MDCCFDHVRNINKQTVWSEFQLNSITYVYYEYKYNRNKKTTTASSGAAWWPIRHSADKVESHYKGSNTRNMWAALKNHLWLQSKDQQCWCRVRISPRGSEHLLCTLWEQLPGCGDPRGPGGPLPPVISRADVWRSFIRINTHKAPGPDGIPGRALKVCADQLADVFTDIFNLSLLQSVVPACFKETIIVPVPQKTKTLCLNDYRPVAFVFSRQALAGRVHARCLAWNSKQLISMWWISHADM